MGANAAGIYGAQLYRSDDEPRYRRAFSVCIAVLSLGIVIATIRKVDEIIFRRKNGGQARRESTQEEKEMFDELNTARAPSNAIPHPDQVMSDVKPVVAQET